MLALIPVQGKYQNWSVGKVLDGAALADKQVYQQMISANIITEESLQQDIRQELEVASKIAKEAQQQVQPNCQQLVIMEKAKQQVQQKTQELDKANRKKEEVQQQVQQCNKRIRQLEQEAAQQCALVQQVKEKVCLYTA